MRKLKQYILCLFMLTPMLVLLGHDIIPHHHHLLQAETNEAVSIVQVHQHVHSKSICNHTNNAGLQWNHQQEKSSETCCLLTHHRVQKELKFQIFLSASSIQLNAISPQKVQKLKTGNSKLIIGPFRLTPLLRGPPSLHFV